MHSPSMPSDSLLVATMRTPGQSRNSSPVMMAQEPTRCSQLSRTISSSQTRDRTQEPARPRAPRVPPCPDSRQCGGDQLRVTDAGQLHEPRAVGKCSGDLTCHAQREPGLADSTHTGQRDETAVREHRTDLGDLGSTPHQAGDLRWEVAGSAGAQHHLCTTHVVRSWGTSIAHRAAVRHAPPLLPPAGTPLSPGVPSLTRDWRAPRRTRCCSCEWGGSGATGCRAASAGGRPRRGTAGRPRGAPRRGTW